MKEEENSGAIQCTLYVIDQIGNAVSHVKDLMVFLLRGREKELCRRVEARIEKTRVDKDTRKPKESTNPGPWGLTETKPPTKEHPWARPSPPTHL